MADHGLFQLELGDMLHEPGFDTHEEPVSCAINLKKHVDNAALRNMVLQRRMSPP
jgi:hypothetical protein